MDKAEAYFGRTSSSNFTRWFFAKQSFGFIINSALVLDFLIWVRVHLYFFSCCRYYYSLIKVTFRKKKKLYRVSNGSCSNQAMS